MAALRRLCCRVVSAARARSARLLAPLAGLLGGVLSSAPAAAVTLPEDTAEAMYHLFDGGDLTAQGPALLVRKSLFDKVSVTGTYYVDMVSNASIDVVTTASPFKETRQRVHRRRRVRVSRLAAQRLPTATATSPTTRLRL